MLLGTDEQNRTATGDQVTHECVRGLDALKGLLQVDDVNVVSLTKDEATHLGVPTTGLVAEMNSGFQKLTHRDDGHSTVLLILQLGARDLASQSDDCRMRTMHFDVVQELVSCWAHASGTLPKSAISPAKRGSTTQPTLGGATTGLGVWNEADPRTAARQK